MKNEIKVCSRCVMDTTDPDIQFDEVGVCNHCKFAMRQLEILNAKKRTFDMDKYVEQVRRDGKDKKYDCIVGLSGGVDSCYVMYLLKSKGLNPLAVHIDNGWNTELAEDNIRNIVKKLGVDLYTYKVNWKEFRDLQLAFLKASTPDSEIPTDHTIRPILSLVADHYHVKHIVFGINSATESIVPRAWSYGHTDWKYIKSVHKIYGTVPLKSYVYHTRLMRYFFYYKQEWINILDYIDYNKEEAKKFLIQNFGWRDYGGKHYESFYTRFYQSYILPKKFGFDKRKMHLSNLIVSGQMNREEALRELKVLPYDEKEIEKDIDYFCEKMAITRAEFDEIMEKKPLSFNDYPSYENDLIGRIINKIVDMWGNK